MRIHCIGCEVLARPLYRFASSSPHLITIELLEKSRHNWPNDLRTCLQEYIDRVDPGRTDAIALGYGLCGRSIVGLQAPELPVVVPRAHDCITLYLGSRTRYQEEFEKEPGTFWYVQDYIERDLNSKPSEPRLGIGAGFDTDYRALREEYVQKYGEDNADYLLEIMGGWHQHYRRAAFIDLATGDSTAAETLARTEAGNRGWAFERMDGDQTLIRKLLYGDWDDDFLVVEPGQRLDASTDLDIIRLQPGDRDRDAALT